MFKLDTIDRQRIAISIAGAVLMSAVCIVGAARPAEAAGGAKSEACTPVRLPSPIAA